MWTPVIVRKFREEKEVGVRRCLGKGYGVGFWKVIIKIGRFLKVGFASLLGMGGKSSFGWTSGMVIVC